MQMFSTRQRKKLSNQPLIIAEEISARSKWQYYEWCVAYLFVRVTQAIFLDYNAL